MITRIRELLETRQLTPTQFADLIGVGRPVISHILSERNKPSLEVVQKIIGAFPDVSLHWLLTGIGSMQVSAAPLSSPIVAQMALPEPQVAPPTPIPSPQASQAPSSIATPVARPAQLPLPPKFRPGAKATSQVATTSPSPAPNPSISTAPVEALAPMPTAPPLPEVAVALTPAPVTPVSTLVPTPAPVPLPAPASLTNETPAPAQATTPVSTAMTEPAAATPTNPAAALSFLGEPGKAIRRIVIFYRDGSFSDYVPEGF